MSDFINPKCPVCGNEFGRRAVGKLTSVVGFRQRVTCSQCGTSVRWNSDARKNIKRIAYLWLVAAAIMICGILGSYDLAPFLAQHNSLFILLGVLLNFGCIYLVRHLAQDYTLEPVIVSPASCE